MDTGPGCLPQRRIVTLKESEEVHDLMCTYDRIIIKK
jgi:hypothetical protein